MIGGRGGRETKKEVSNFGSVRSEQDPYVHVAWRCKGACSETGLLVAPFPNVPKRRVESVIEETAGEVIVMAECCCTDYLTRIGEVSWVGCYSNSIFSVRVEEVVVEVQGRVYQCFTGVVIEESAASVNFIIVVRIGRSSL